MLDGWLFRDARAAAFAAALEAGSARWLACGRMRDELVRVLAYPHLVRWMTGDGGGVLRAFDRLADIRPDPPPAPRSLHCRDADDQVFIDLALACRASWLVTHDRALIDLRRAANVHGIQIVTPANWSLHAARDSTSART